jgi:hypothetical protein
MERIQQLGRAVVVVAVLAAVGGCVSIPQRAWQNGASISSSPAYRSMMRGDRSFQTMRQVYGSLDPYRSQYQARPYQPFTHW